MSAKRSIRGICSDPTDEVTVLQVPFSSCHSQDNHPDKDGDRTADANSSWNIRPETQGTALKQKTDIVAVASSGGHWQQLLLATEKLRDRNIFFVTTKPELLVQAGIGNGTTVPDCNRDTPIQLAKSVMKCLSIIFGHRPSVIISTGAAPGIICLTAGRLIGAHTIWIDSFANVEQLSMSGKIARYIAKTWLTQWEHVSTPQGPHYAGELL